MQLTPPPTPDKVLLSIIFTKRESDPPSFGTLYDVKYNFTDGSTLLSIHSGENFEHFRPPSNLVAVLQDGQMVDSIPPSFLNWLSFTE